MSDIPAKFLSWKPYPKVPYSLADVGRAASSVPWVVTEKVHGAHMSILVCDDGMSFAKRKQILAPDDNFFQFQMIRDDLQCKASEAWKIVSRMIGDVAYIDIHGEIFGGRYPYPNLEDSSLIPVQSGIWYCPHIDFIVYDIAVYFTARQPRFMSYAKMQQVAKSAGFHVSEALFSGRMEDAFSYQYRFHTTIPSELFGLPNITDNFAEGIVIRPCIHSMIEDENEPHVLVKIKAEEFAEIESSTEFCQQSAVGAILGRVNSNRVTAAYSKIGFDKDYRLNGLNEIVDEIFSDVIAEICTDPKHLTSVAAINKMDISRIRDHIVSVIRKTISAYADGVYLK